MEDNVISVDTLEDKEYVASMFSKYDFLSLPVVDRENRMVGIVTFDDAMDVIEEETTEDFSKMAATATAVDTDCFRFHSCEKQNSMAFDTYAVSYPYGCYRKQISVCFCGCPCFGIVPVNA